MRNKITLYSIITIIFLLSFTTNAISQPLTVKEIMKEPSIAGMRVSGEQLSPDGKWVVYRWNAEWKNPRDLYLVPNSGGDA